MGTTAVGDLPVILTLPSVSPFVLKGPPKKKEKGVESAIGEAELWLNRATQMSPFLGRQKKLK